MRAHILKSLIVIFTLSLAGAVQALSQSSMKIDETHVNNWNQFTDELYQFHLYQLKRHTIEKKSSLGGYSGLPEYYEEIFYYDSETNRLLSRIQWENNDARNIHLIEVFVYGSEGRLKADYLSAFLPEHRNAPIQTLINLHYNDPEFKSFRQFDASGARIYEQCNGSFMGEDLSISLEEDDFYSSNSHIIKTLDSEEYRQCFEMIPAIVSPYMSPFKAKGLPSPATANLNVNLNNELKALEQTDASIQKLNEAISLSANPARLYMQRGQLYFEIQDFSASVADFTKAIELNNNLDDAYFGRGMAQGRLGHVAQGIQDLTVYLDRNPNSSHAYTKRGVRYIWLGELNNARKDLQTAIKLNPKNAEAHDDLGVVYASDGKIDRAISQFQKVVAIDPTYQKGFHNLAMSLHIKGNSKRALTQIEKALDLSPDNKNSILLKGEILKSIGMTDEAEKLFSQAENLPDGNWSERFSIK